MRSNRWTRLVEDKLRLISAVVRHRYIGWRRSRGARATYASLQELDEYTLRDLGFARSEILSVAAEIAGAAEATRLRSRTASIKSTAMRRGL